MSACSSRTAGGAVKPFMRSAAFLLLQLRVSVPYALLAALRFSLPPQRRHHIIMGGCRTHARMIRGRFGIRLRSAEAASV